MYPGEVGPVMVVQSVTVGTARYNLHSGGMANPAPACHRKPFLASAWHPAAVSQVSLNS